MLALTVEQIESAFFIFQRYQGGSAEDFKNVLIEKMKIMSEENNPMIPQPYLETLSTETIDKLHMDLGVIYNNGVTAEVNQFLVAMEQEMGRIKFERE
jgi:ferredoxin-fold anticodon binding domain-containing protein